MTYDSTMSGPPSTAQATAEFSDQVSNLVRSYFSSPARTLYLDDDEELMVEGACNQRLYYVVEGQLIGHSEDEGEIPGDFLIARAGEFVGLQSFSLPGMRCAMTVKSEGKSIVCFASLDDIRAHTSLAPEQVLLPIFIRSMLSRQKLAYRLRAEERVTERRLRDMQEMSQLGQFAAGVAHELNNAISVIDRGADWLAQALETQVKQCSTEAEFHVFHLGLHKGRAVPSREARACAKKLKKDLKLSDASARKVGPMGLSPDFLKAHETELEGSAERFHELWELGATFRDLTIAAEQAAGVVESMKHLGGGQMPGAATTDVNTTIHLAMTIMRSLSSGLDLHCNLSETPVPVRVNKGELVQVWVNLISNSCDAIFQRDGPRRFAGPDSLWIDSKIKGDQVVVTVKDTGPGIPEANLSTIFQPNFTTKKTGLSFGLGIGLSIVRRIVTAAGGSVGASNWKAGAVMTVTLPIAPATSTALGASSTPVQETTLL